MRLPGKLGLAGAVALVLTGSHAVADECPPSADPFYVELQDGCFTPVAGIFGLDSLPTDDSDGLKPALLQFRSRLSPADHDLLDLEGVRLTCYLGRTLYLAEVPVPLPGPVQALLRWAAPYRSSHRLSTYLRSGAIFDWARNGQDDEIAVLVQTFPSYTPDQINRLLAFAGDAEPFGPTSWKMRLTEAEISDLAEKDFVQFIQQGPIPAIPLNNEGRRLTRSDDVQALDESNGEYRGMSGQGVVIGIFDYGIDPDHPDFKSPDGDSRLRAEHTEPLTEHGTVVASVAAGNGLASEDSGYDAYELRGHAPESLLVALPIIREDLNEWMHTALNEDGVDVSNHSYYQSLEAYDIVASEIDTIVRGDATYTDDDGVTHDLPPIPQVWGAGNYCHGAATGSGPEETGYFSVATSAKNTISVGSLDTDSVERSEFSSLGPTYDGRFKPDIVAPGCHTSVTEAQLMTGDGIRAALKDGDDYTVACGTSLSAPAVTGLVALAMQTFDDTYGLRPDLPSTYKALLVQTAADLRREYREETEINPDMVEPEYPTVYTAGPDFATGHGKADAGELTGLISYRDRWLEPDASQAGTSRTWCVPVSSGDDELKVTLAWDDEPQCVCDAWVSNKIVNDLDLKLIAPDGEEYLPWTRPRLSLRADPSEPGVDDVKPEEIIDAVRGRDEINNVEMASVDDPEAGNWTVEVMTTALPMDRLQPYSLVASHDLFDACPDDDEGEGEDDDDEDCEGIGCLRKGPVFGGKLLDGRLPFPLEKICRYVVKCPRCAVGVRGLCAGLWVRLREIPGDAVVTIVNQTARKLARDSDNGPHRYLQVKDISPSDRLFLIFKDRKGKPYPGRVRLDIQVESLAKRPAVRTANRAFRPEAGIADDIKAKIRQRSGDPVHAIVTFMVPPDPVERALLRREGIGLATHLGDGAYLAAIERRSSFKKVDHLIHSVTALAVADKIEPAVWQQIETTKADSRGAFSVRAHFHDYVPAKRAMDTLEALGIRAEPRLGGWTSVVTSEQVLELAAEPSLRWIALQPGLDDQAAGEARAASGRRQVGRTSP